MLEDLHGFKHQAEAAVFEDLPGSHQQAEATKLEDLHSLVSQAPHTSWQGTALMCLSPKKIQFLTSFYLFL